MVALGLVFNWEAMKIIADMPHEPQEYIAGTGPGHKFE
jgi:hypothetical protein